MHWLEAILIGLIQGLTEFLPVSSSGHIVILETLLGVTEGGVLFTVVIHAATLVAVVLFYRARIARLLQGALRFDPEVLRYIAKLALATLPAVLVVLAAQDFVERTLGSSVVAAWGLLLTGALLWTTRLTLGRGQALEPSWQGALFVGCAQAVALLPGVSRSGTTIVAALFVGMTPLAAAEFSFLMAVIAISGAVVLKFPELQMASDALSVDLLTSFSASLISGLAALWLFVRLLRDQRFYHFSYYVWSVGIAFLGWHYFLR